ncbi:hypothetical protein KIW84_064872 [Lathyrus oleraceus]|uniref:Uncharacterized protein n=1 Tax=Pisum sativum TaxID=3888 RepID=A0A9D5A8U0_PEA|nr:hypothetical protein KIW84_064872 [Pisum sativum]
MNGWREVTTVQFVERRWNSMRQYTLDNLEVDKETINTQQVHSSTSENAMNLSSDVHGLPEASVSNAEIKPNNSPYHNGVEHVHAAYLKPAGFVSKQEKQNARQFNNNNQTTLRNRYYHVKFGT